MFATNIKKIIPFLGMILLIFDEKRAYSFETLPPELSSLEIVFGSL